MKASMSKGGFLEEHVQCYPTHYEWVLVNDIIDKLIGHVDEDKRTVRRGDAIMDKLNSPSRTDPRKTKIIKQTQKTIGNIDTIMTKVENESGTIETKWIKGRIHNKDNKVESGWISTYSPLWRCTV